MTIIVTGATGGLGLTIAGRLLQAGYAVVGVARKPNAGFGELENCYGDRVRFLACDLSEPAKIKQTVWGAMHDQVIHGLVNNAAVAYDDLLTNLNLQRLESMFQTNVFAAMELTKLTVRNMLLHGTRGSVVHISSISVHTGYKGLSMYAATKGALEAFSKNAAREWGSLGIRSNCVVAGFMETAMSAGLSAEQKERIYQRTALKQPTDIDSVASMVEFLLSGRSASITGQSMFVDAGTI